MHTDEDKKKILLRIKICNDIANYFLDSIPPQVQFRDDKTILFLHFSFLAASHFDSMIILSDQKRYISAMALLRPFFDAYVNSFAMYYLEDEREKFKTTGEVNKSVQNLLTKLTNNGHEVAGIPRESLQMMHDHVHGNWSAIQNMCYEGADQRKEITNEIKPSLVFDVLGYVGSCAIQHIIELKSTFDTLGEGEHGDINNLMDRLVAA